MGIWEVWEVDLVKFDKGFIVYIFGYLFFKDVYGGLFMYYFGDNLVSFGLVVVFDYKNFWFLLYGEF